MFVASLTYFCVCLQKSATEVEGFGDDFSSREQGDGGSGERGGKSPIKSSTGETRHNSSTEGRGEGGRGDKVRN